MQVNNWHTHHGQVGSFGDSDDGSSSGQGSFTNDSTDLSSQYWATATEYFLDPSGQAAAISGGASQSAITNPTTNEGQASPPASTMVGSRGGLQFDLIWDSSVAAAPPGFRQAIVDAAELYSALFSNQAVIAIDVTYGEILGQTLPSFALGASANNGYTANYNTVTSALSRDGFSFSAANEPTASQFFVSSAEAKAMGFQVSGLDGFIGFSDLSGTGYSWSTPGSYGRNSTIAPNQFDLQAVAEHEISEVMGRIEMDGYTVINNLPTYTPLDLFNYQSPGVLDVSANGGYFSVNNGLFSLGNYNNAVAYGGDIADWASATSITQSNTLGLPRGSYDAYDAFTFPGVNGQLSLSDIIEDAALGYTLKPAASIALLANYAASFGGAAGFHGDLASAHEAQATNQQLLAVPH